jgi:DNA-binding NarL/FixJ family response regulator
MNGHRVDDARIDEAQLRILVVDDHPVFRMGLVALLSSLDGLVVVAEAESVATAIAAVDRHDVDVVMMDLHLGEESGVEATRQIIARHPDVGVLVVTMIDDEDTVFAAMRAGARGYLLKGAGPVEIERALRAVAAGEFLLAPAVAARAMPLMIGGARRGPVAFPSLTDREREVLELVAQGLDNLRIARRLGVSDKTVRNHLSNVLNKLGVADRAAAIAKARDAGLGESLA